MPTCTPLVVDVGPGLISIFLQGLTIVSIYVAWRTGRAALLAIPPTVVQQLIKANGTTPLSGGH
jgi:hypothetical protein